MKARIDVRVLKAISAFASTEETRYYLNGVSVEIEPRAVTYVATDGHRLVVFHDDEFDDENENTLLGKFIIPTAQCKAHVVKKSDLSLGTLSSDDSGSLTLTFCDVGVIFKPIDGSFPNWRNVPPKNNPSGVTAQFNLNYAQSFAKFAADLALPIPTIAHNQLDPAIVQFGPLNHVFGVLMPMTSSADLSRTMPEWARLSVSEAAE
jgi:hypothetical protein